MLLIFLQAKIGQNFENAGQIWGKDRAKIELLYSANGKNGASGLGVYAVLCAVKHEIVCPVFFADDGSRPAVDQ